ncbi:hypothetical protein JTB14_036380 [Gonioctena quinquepunctata]|nr:hypothetical protein JTB14_036380 [Gonioctena quinquepunctata]
MCYGADSATKTRGTFSQWSNLPHLNRIKKLGSVKKCDKLIPTPDLVPPFPRPCIKKKKNGGNKKRKSLIYTDTPEENRLEQLKYERGLRKRNKEKKIQN